MSNTSKKQSNILHCNPKAIHDSKLLVCVPDISRKQTVLPDARDEFFNSKCFNLNFRQMG